MKPGFPVITRGFLPLEACHIFVKLPSYSDSWPPIAKAVGLASTQLLSEEKGATESGGIICGSIRKKIVRRREKMRGYGSRQRDSCGAEWVFPVIGDDFGMLKMHLMAVVSHLIPPHPPCISPAVSNMGDMSAKGRVARSAHHALGPSTSLMRTT